MNLLTVRMPHLNLPALWTAIFISILTQSSSIQLSQESHNWKYHLNNLVQTSKSPQSWRYFEMVKYRKCYRFYYSWKSKRYWLGVKSIAFGGKSQFWSNTFHFLAIPFTFCNCNKRYSTSTFNHIMYNISDFLLVPASNKRYSGCALVPFIARWNQ